jgi:hypothetical protein
MRSSAQLLLGVCIFFVVGNIYSQPPSFCSTNRFTDVALFDSSDIRIDSNIVYGISKNYFSNVNDTLMMDVFYPDTITDTMSARPFILLIHGGAFMSGNRREMDYQCMEFARRGFVTATISYRLGWNCTGTDFLSICLLCGNLNVNIKTATYEAAQDGRAAMRYINANAAQYKIDPSNYFIGGTSAGSITTLHVAYWDQQEANAFCSACTGQVGLLDTSGNSLPDNYQFKGVIDNCGGITKDSSLLNNGNLPMISFHDEGDCIVPNQYGQVISCFCQSFYWVAGSSSMHNLLLSNGICTSMNLVPLSINHCSFPQYELVNRASCFMRSVMCDSCTTSSNTTPFVGQRCSYFDNMTEDDLSQVNIFPNPAQEKFYLNGFKPGKLYTLLLMDLFGKVLIKKVVFQKTAFTFNLDDIPTGAYILKISSEGNETGRLVLVSE